MSSPAPTTAPPAAGPSLSAYFDGSPVPAFAIDASHRVTQWNRACERVTGVAASAMIGTRDHWRAFYAEPRPLLADLVLRAQLEPVDGSRYDGGCQPSASIPGAYEVEAFFPSLGTDGMWMFFTAAPLRDAEGRVVGAIEVLQDVTQRRRAEDALRQARLRLEDQVRSRTAELAAANAELASDVRRREAAEAELRHRNAELTELNKRLVAAREQLVQSEKMASIGQLAAGVAHEINNPIGYVFSNFGSLEGYVADLLGMLAEYEQAEAALTDPALRARLAGRRARIDLDYLKTDISALMAESREGIARVRKIVQDLKDFSRTDNTEEWQWADLHAGIDSTLNIVANEVKYKADVVREYGTLPDIECRPSQINQVVLNIVVNAAQAMSGARGRITIRTGHAGEQVWIEIADNGPGIAPKVLPKIFDPFFTTKPVGAGTGLGLALSYGIVRKHHGSIDVHTALGQGTTFRITLPVHQSTPTEAA